MTNPYASLPEDRFWKTGVHRFGAAVAPKMAKTLSVQPGARLATAGSCFAQNLAKRLQTRSDITFLQTETLVEGDPVFSARYGNIYTAAQLLQLFREAEAGHADPSCAIRRADGRFVDVNRPFIAPDGFASVDEVVASRQTHLRATRQVFRDSDVLVFTLGLTEAWRQADTGWVFPVCPLIYTDTPGFDCAFHNYDLSEVEAAMDAFVAEATAINPGLRLLLTVSPVPLTATYGNDHVLVATMHSKSVLRVACSTLAQRHDAVFYFPSYEMVANPYSAGSSYAAENMRTVTPDAVSMVMDFFEAEYLAQTSATPSGAAMPTMPDVAAGDAPDDDVICDDVEIEKSIGF